MHKLTDRIDATELGCLLTISNSNDHPHFIFFLLYQCRQHVRHGTTWSQLGTTEYQLKTLLNACQINRLVKRLGVILAKNQKKPLNFRDSQKLWLILGELENHNVDWRQLPISRDGLLAIIELAEEGYTHLVQTA